MKHQIVGDVRGGLGLLAAIELVKDKTTKEKLDPKTIRKMQESMIKHKLLGRATDFIPISTPLCVNKDEIDHFISQMDSAITEVEPTI